MDLNDVMKNRFTVSAHRGYSYKYPENTLLAFQEAIELGVDMLELDLHLSADGVLSTEHERGVHHVHQLLFASLSTSD